MLNAWIRWSLNNRPLVLALAAGFLAWGGYVMTRLPVDVLPDLTAPTVTVIIENPGMAPTDMEYLVTFPVEAAMNGASGVRRVRSATAVGVAIIWVEFDWGEDVYRARQTVTERLNVASESLPPGTGRPVLAPISSIMGEVLFIALTSDRHTPLELRTVADTVIRRRVLAVSGVAQVTPIGGGQKQYQVLLEPEKLRAYQISLNEVQEALRAANENTSAGFRVDGGQEYLIQGFGRYTDLDEIRRTVVTEANATPVYVGDLGKVQIGEALKRGEGSLNGEPAVVIGIRKQPETNTLELTEAIDSVLTDIEASLPAGMTIHRDVFRQADFIEVAIANLEEALVYGGILVVAVVIAFLANARASIITLFAIPFSLVAAFLGLDALGLTINSMTLGGLAIAIGELVDDAVIDVENVFRRLRQNASLAEGGRRPVLEVVYLASSEIRGSVVFATIIVMLVFAPLFFLSGVEGRLLQPLGFAYLVALLASLVVALTVTPVLCSYLLPRAKAVLKGEDPTLIRFLKRLYGPVIGWSLRHSLLVMASSAILLAASIASFAWMGRSFLPEFNEGTLTISAVTIPGTSLEESDRLGSALEEILLGVPEVVSTGRRTGRAELDEHLQGVESAEIDVRLVMKDRPKEEVLEEIRQKATLIPGTNVNIGQPISHRIDHMLSGTRSNIAVKIFGDDLRMLRAVAQQVEAALRDIAGVVDLATEQQTDIPTVSVRFKREALARYGLPAGAAAEALRTVFLGQEVGSILEGQVAFPLVVRYEGGRPEQMETIRQAMIDTPSGARVPLAAIAEIREDRSPNFVTRENVQRKIVVSCNVAGRDLRSVVNDIQAHIANEVTLPQGYRVEYGGQFESEAEASRRLLLLGGLVVLGILVILTTAFASWKDALIIMCNLPLALIGGVAGVFLAGGVLSVASLIGFITLFGIATRNGIMLISHINHLIQEENVTEFREAVVRGSSERLAPILMTAMSTGLALIPIGLGLGETGSEIHAPLALVVLSGLFTSTALNMIVVPAVYWRFHRQRT
jgi:CzcA family heavy metal efflux pump